MEQHVFTNIDSAVIIK
nr:hypothetical protein [Desulforamulus aquiferis]